jgi:hypothetical protein
MSLSDDARKRLADLQGRFKAAAAIHPDLKHVLIETPTVEAFNDADVRVAFAFDRVPFSPIPEGYDREVQRTWSGTSDIQVFIATDFHRGRKALDALSSLADDAVELLTAFESELPWQTILRPAAVEPGLYDITSRWMACVHRVAQHRRPGDWLRSTPGRSIGSGDVTEGATV